MNNFMLLILILVACLVSIEAVDARPIVSARDGTGTRVKISGSNPRQFDIGGGTRAGANLFHSLQKFGLSRGQIANFLSKPDVRNILSRVVGGEASLIHGLMKVTGGKSNLYFMNPAGIVFGKEARLNVPGSFIATTAKGVQVGEEWFKGAGSNDYAKLAGSPSGLGFTEEGSGAIVNAGDLAVAPGEHIALVGGKVINTGKLSAPGGVVTIAAVPGEKLVRVSQEGQVLALELPVAAKAELTSDVQTVTPASLAALLTGGDLEEAAGMAVEENGVVKLTASNTTIPDSPGVAIASGTLDVSNTGDSAGKALGGKVNILGEKVGLVGTRVNASGTNGGGRVLVGGDYKGQGEVPTAKRTYVSRDSTIRADALEEGSGGKVVVWSDETTAFHGDISARGGEGSGDGGFVEVSGKEHLAFHGDVDLGAAHGKQGSLLLDPKNITIVDQNAAANDGTLNDNNILQDDGGDNSTFTLSRGKLESLPAANVTLEAKNNITIENISGDNDNELNLQTGLGNRVKFIADADNDKEGSFSMHRSDTIKTNGGNLTIRGADVTVGNIDTFNVGDFSLGNVSLRATAGQLSLRNIIDGALDVDLASSGNIRTGQIRVLGNIKAVSTHASIVAAPSGNIVTDDLLVARDGTPTNPTVELTASQGDIVVDGSIRSGIADSDGIVKIKAGGLLRVNESSDPSIDYSIFADSNGGFDPPKSIHVLQIKAGDKILERRGQGTFSGPGPKILIEVGKGPFSSGEGTIPNGESGTAGIIEISETNGGPVTSFQGRLFGSPDSPTPSSPDSPIPSSPDSPTPSTTLAAQTLEYDDDAGEQDSEEEACPPSDPACQPDEASLLDVSAVLPNVPTR